MASGPMPFPAPMPGPNQQPPFSGPGGPGPVGFPGGQPGGFMPPPPSIPSPGLDPEFAPATPEVYEIDPLVLTRPVKIHIEGSSRMQSRSALQQMWAFLGPNIFQGPFLQGLAGQGNTVDFLEVARMMQDAVGSGRTYRIFRPMNQQEAQMHGQPSPDMKAKMQIASQEQQTRTSIMGMKQQGEQARMQVEALLKNKQIDEESAKHILGLLAQQQNEQVKKPDPQVELQKQRVELQGKQAEQQMKLQHMQAEHGLKLRQQAQQSQMDMHTQGLQHQMDMQRAQMDLQNAHQQSQIKARSLLAQGAAKAEASRMQPKKPVAQGQQEAKRQR